MDLQTNKILYTAKQSTIYGSSALIGLALYAWAQRNWKIGVGSGVAILLFNTAIKITPESRGKRLSKGLVVSLFTATAYAATQRYLPSLAVLSVTSFLCVHSARKASVTSSLNKQPQSPKLDDEQHSSQKSKITDQDEQQDTHQEQRPATPSSSSELQQSFSSASPSPQQQETTTVRSSATTITRPPVEEVHQVESPPPPQQRGSVTNQPSTPTMTTPSIEQARQVESLPPRRKETPFWPFTIKVAEKPLPTISSEEEMRVKAREISQRVSDGHLNISIDIPPYDPTRQQAMKFLEELRAGAEVISTRRENLFYIIPKKTEQSQDGLIIRRYDNGVVEEVQTARESAWEDWEGRRIYPNGVIEKGRFERFCWNKGTRIEKGITTYCLPETLIKSYALDRGLMYSEVNGEKRLIVIHKRPGSAQYSSEYVQIEEDLILTLTNLLKDENPRFLGRNLKEILAGPINCKEFVEFLFETNAIFSLQPSPLKVLLKLIQERKLVVNLQHQHPETKETLLDCYSDQADILKLLLAMEPALLQRTEGMEIAAVRSLLVGDTEAASLLFAAMGERNIELQPRELLFKKVALAEGEVTVEELKIFSQKDQEIAYRLANIHSQLKVVQIMNTLGFTRTEELLMREGPSIFGCNMDALEMYKGLHGFMARLRSEKLLLTRSEFDRLPEKNYMEKGSDIGRILGRDYIERKALELGLKHVKVPKKTIVIDNDTDLNLCISSGLEINVMGNNITVYAERIQAARRQITLEEVSELLRLFEAVGFSDIHWGNIMIAEDGVYIIDTEFTNFWICRWYFKNGRQFVEMAKIVHALPGEHQGKLIKELNAKIEAYQQHEEKLNEQRIARLKVEQAALQKSGCCYSPCFSFPAHEIINLGAIQGDFTSKNLTTDV